MAPIAPMRIPTKLMIPISTTDTFICSFLCFVHCYAPGEGDQLIHPCNCFCFECIMLDVFKGCNEKFLAYFAQLRFKPSNKQVFYRYLRFCRRCP
jgi:hypothetical protein